MDARIRFFLVGGVAKAPVTVVVQLMINYERRGQGGGSGPYEGLWYGGCLEIDSWQRAVWAGVVR